MMPIKLVLKKKTILAFVINLAVIEAGLEAVNEKILLREREREREREKRLDQKLYFLLLLEPSDYGSV